MATRISRRAATLTLGALWVSAPQAQSPVPEQLAEQQRRLGEFIAQSRAPDVLALLGTLPHGARFAQAVEASGLAARIAALPEVTVFVPQDEAWEAGSGTPPAAAVVARHVCVGLWTQKGERSAELRSLDGSIVRAGPGGIEGVEAERTGVRARTGWVHVLSSFLPAGR